MEVVLVLQPMLRCGYAESMQVLLNRSALHCLQLVVWLSKAAAGPDSAERPFRACMLAAFVRGDDEDTMHDDATWLLDFYDTFKDCLGKDVLDLALNSLAKVEGSFGEYSLNSGTCSLIMSRACCEEMAGLTAGWCLDFVLQGYAQ